MLFSLILDALAAAALLVSGGGMPGNATRLGAFPPVLRHLQAQPLRPSVLPKSIQLGAHLHPDSIPAGAHRGLHMDGKRQQLFLTDDYGYIWQLNAHGKRVTAYASDCAGAEGAKVDHAGNLWVACTNSKTVDMYSRAKTIDGAATVLNDTVAGIPYFASDVAVGADGTVFAASLYAFTCQSTCRFYPGQISYWLPSNLCNGCTPSGQVSDSNLNEQAYFLDVDANGTLYVDYYGCNPSFTLCGNGFDRIDNPLTSPSVSTLVDIASGSIATPGGVAVLSDGTPTLLDQTSGTITQYTATPFVWLTVAQNVFGGCNPVAGGFSSGESKMAVADSGCHSIDVGDVSNDSWNLNANADFGDPVAAAYDPSNK